ncbi:hypothetical protein [Dongia sp.]|uniref:hypothetical protein n=1 Tax=Dongia sp. TaxID=1977262 RepID=UPI0035B37B5E
MSSAINQSAANENNPAFAIEVSGISAGLALRERGGFSFIAADPRFRIIEGSRFRRLAQLEDAVRTLAKAVGN